MEYQKIANLLNDESKEPSKFKTKNWVEINDDVRGVYSSNKQSRFKTLMLRSSLRGYNRNKKLIFKNCAPFSNCISKINNTQIDNVEYIDIVMPMHNLIEYSDNYSKTSGSLWQYCKEIPDLDDDGDIADFDGANANDSFNFKTKITGQTNNNGIINVEIMVPLKHLSNFWRTLETPLINCEVELFLTWSADFVIIYTNIDGQVPKFTITETNLYVPKFLYQLKIIQNYYHN